MSTRGSARVGESLPETEEPLAARESREPAVRAGTVLPAAALPLLAFVAYLAFALIVTWPWVIDPSATLFGVVGGDLTTSIAGFQQFAEERQPPFMPGEVTQLNAPEGAATNWAVNLAAFGSTTTLWLLSIALGSVAAHGLVAVLGFAFSALAMFLLVRAVTDHAGAAFVVGLAFGFWPFMYATGWTWPHYIHLWVLVLLTWRMLVAIEVPTARNGLLAGVAAVFAMTWIQYNLLIAGVLFTTLAALGVARGVARRRLKPHLLTQSIAAAPAAVVVIALLAAAAVSDYAGIPIHSEADAVANSARPAMYVVPGPGHPLAGETTARWLFERFSPTVEEPPPGKAIYAEIYLGLPLLILALFGAMWALSMLRRGPRSSARSTSVGVGLAALAVGAVAFAFSAPPRVSVFGLLVPMPYALVQHATEVFRVAHRFAVVVMLAVCLLAGLGLAALLRRRRFGVQVSAVAALAVVMAVDLRAMPSPRTTKVAYPPIYEALEAQPPGIVAEYPPEPLAVVERLRSFYQDAHEHPLFAGAPADTAAESRKLELQHLLAERTVADLAEYGVRYVIVHQTATPLVPPGGPVRGLRAISVGGDATLYRVVARPSSFTSYGAEGFHRLEGDQSGGGRWIGKNGAELELRGRCRPCVGTVTFATASLAEPRLLTIRDAEGRTLFDGRVGIRGDVVRFNVRFSGRTLVYLSTEPPPVRVDSVIPSPDTRTVSVYLAHPVRFIPNVRRGHRPAP